LKNRSTVLVNGIEAATLGHMLKGDVIEHEFLGTDRVINDLIKFDEYENGLINLEP